MMISEATWRFVREHANDDVRRLALQGSRDKEVDMVMALQQIQGRQAARRKLPSWAEKEGIVYPSHLSMEQCSSEATARYKARVAASLDEHHTLIDLTGGFGVDFAFMSEAYAEAIYVEQQPQLCDVVAHNLAILYPKVAKFRTETADVSGGKFHIETADGVAFLRQMPPGRASLIYLDPARRDDHGGRTYGIGDCTPNVLLLMDELLQKASHVMLKLSPMLDWRKAVSDVGREHVEQVHIVSVANECKELLLLLSAEGSTAPQLFCVNDGSIEQFPLDPSAPSAQDFPLTPLAPSLQSASYLYEPNASLMKAGFFGALARRYGLDSTAQNSHLYVSSQLVEHFPGRIFRIVDVTTMNRRELKAKVEPLRQANISTRNFPLSVAELRRRLKLGEGGSHYLFATTLANGEHVLIICKRVFQVKSEELRVKS